MYAIAPRLDRRLLELVVRLESTDTSIAEVHRRIREPAAQLDIPRPSYECVRLLVHDARRERARRRSNRETLIRVALYLDGPSALDTIETGLLPSVVTSCHEHGRARRGGWFALCGDRAGDGQ